MVLDQLFDGASRYFSGFDQKTNRLAYILILPLVDGVFATMLVSGYLQTFTSILNTAFTIFAGAGALAVLYSGAETAEEARDMVRKVTPYILVGGVLTGLIAPIFGQIFSIQLLQYATGLAILVIALKISDVEIAESLSVPAVILTGLVLSLQQPSKIQVTLQYVLPAVATVITACGGLYLLAGLENRLNIGIIRKGSIVVLGTISASLFGLNIPSETGLAILAASIIISLRY